MVHLAHELAHSRLTLRHAKLSQMGELYLSTMISSLGRNLIGIFIPVYLYQLGFSIEIIAAYHLFVYGIRIITDNIFGWLVGEFGPKHMMILSHMFSITHLLMLATFEAHNWSLVLLGLLQVLQTGLFYVSYHVAFSKIHSEKKGGQQIGKMFRLVKISGAMGPLVGGAIVTVGDISWILYIAIALIIASAAPLVASPEPVRVHQRITFKGFPWHKVKYDLISNAGLGADQMTSLIVWPLFVSVFIFTDNVYLGVGFLTSLGLISSIFVTKLYGQLIDKHHGKKLLMFSTYGQAALHLVRVFVNSSGFATVINLVSEPLSVGVRMPYSKGVYGAASSHEGYRIVYITSILTSSNIMRALTMALVYGIARTGNDRMALVSVFLLASLTLWIVTLQRYRALQ